MVGYPTRKCVGFLGIWLKMIASYFSFFFVLLRPRKFEESDEQVLLMAIFWKTHSEQQKWPKNENQQLVKRILGRQLLAFAYCYSLSMFISGKKGWTESTNCFGLKLPTVFLGASWWHSGRAWLQCSQSRCGESSAVITTWCVPNCMFVATFWVETAIIYKTFG